MSRAILKPLLFFTLITIIIGLNRVVVCEPTPTGYYLPKGYYVKATLKWPDAPFWPGYSEESIVGLRLPEYDLLIVGRSWKEWNFHKYSQVQIVKVYEGYSGSKYEIVAKLDAQPNVEHEVTIKYDVDGQIKISVDGTFLYSFSASSEKYTIIAENANVNEPQPLQEQSQTGQGYTVSEDNYVMYLALGIGVVLVIIVIFMVVRR
mgnify:CR=1 FL=1